MGYFVRYYQIGRETVTRWGIRGDDFERRAGVQIHDAVCLHFKHSGEPGIMVQEFRDGITEEPSLVLIAGGRDP
jgi:hypothetical protein